MIKMTIGGEEVVCNKEFTIKEEMLSTSSTILNNCYPKSWEQDHDYTSRFYYPKDYSKCLIYDEKNISAEVGEYATGTNLSINVDNTKEWEYQLEGDTQQNTTILPSEYTQVDYIESNGNQYIDTGIKGNENTKIDFKYMINSLTNVMHTIGDITNSSKAISFNIGNSNSPISRWGSNSYTQKTNNVINTIYEVSISQNGYYINGDLWLSPTIDTFTTDNNIYLFSANGASSRLRGKVYYCKIYDNNVLALNLIPCYRNSDNEVGLYDIVNNVFYINQGTGTFTYGSEVDIPNPDYPQDVEVVTGEQTITISQNGETQSYPISLGNIELCKIGQFQDYIYEHNGDWYLHKEIAKHTFYTSEDTNGYNTDLEDVLAINLYPNGMSSMAFKNTTSGYWVYCNNFKYKQGVSNEEHIYLTASVNLGDNNYYGNIRLYINHDRLEGYSSSLTNNQKRELVKTWLENNPTTVYYATRYPNEDTQITDTTLIQQLDNLKNATLYNGINNISVSGDLPSILNLHYNFVTARIETTLLFSGMVKNTGNISLNPREPKYCSLEILDFKDFLSTGEYLDFVISNKTVLEAIQMVVEAVSQYGFVLGNVNIIGGNDIIGAYSTQEKSAYDVFQYLAEITQSRWTTRMIDENTVAIDFYDPTLMPQGQDIDYTSEWWCQNKVNDLKFNYGSRDYRNKQVMLSSQVYGGTDYSETILGDGYNKNFNTAENIGIVKAIYVNGAEVSFATNVDKELGIDAVFYYTPGENIISSNENQSSYSAGTQIIVTYTPLVKGREVVYNTDEVNRINTQLGRKGVVARYEQRNDILYTEDLEKIGQTYIKYKGSAEVILILTTQVDIYNVGEVVYFNAPITELAQNYMVKNKQIQIITTGDYSNVWYTYELTSSFNSETAINWFDNQRNKTNGNISEGEYITRNIDIENTANIIWDNLTITEVTSVGDNILNAPLNAPFTK